MKLCDIVKEKEAVIFGDGETEVFGLSHNTNELKAGDMYFCLKGTKVDGHDFAFDAVKKGASVIVSEKRLELPEGATNVVVGSTRRAMAEFASEFFLNPSKDMIVIMITGTNGKTTTSYMIAKIFESAGKKVGVVGTNGVFVGSKKHESGMTTPDPIFLQQMLAEMKDSGVQIVVMEMSAHALFYEKNWGVMSDISIFSNLTQDHLDFFLDMQSYGQAKKKLFSKKHSKFAVLNADDEFTREIIDGIDIPYVTYARSHDADFALASSCDNFVGQTFDVLFDGGRLDAKINLAGLFNISNALSAIAAAKLCGVSNEHIRSGLLKLESVPGRFNVKIAAGKKWVIDYAHTPDGLVNILSSARELLNKANGGKLISVFGCGGNRDKLKRPLMGEISSRLSDITVITSDNPRFEEPERIIDEIASGVNAGAKVFKEVNRKKAIALASKLAGENDIIVVSGKGAEDYIDIQGEKVHYSDNEAIEELETIEELGEGGRE